jgi:cytochrome c-type biogenesis protein CcmF
MENVASLAILLALCLTVYAIVASIAGGRKPLLALSAYRAVYAVWFLVTLASAILLYAFLTDDFRFATVASHSNRSLTLSYKVAAWWGGQEGSLLFWSWLLSCYAAVALFMHRRGPRDSMPYTVAILMSTQAFFLLLNAFVASPFQVIGQNGLVVAVPDGVGLNPLLQNPLMRIHPPILYLGYVGMVVPFAFAMGALMQRQPGDAWIHRTRRWSLVTWLFQGAGVLLGARWAYAALGWGGYWAWDPVENASRLPWLSSTAFLHSVMMQEKKGMMKIWNAVLVAGSFFLCIFGTMMTRSGMVNSVHSFAQSPIGRYFVCFLAVGIAGTIYLILDRLDFLKSEAALEGVVSRESSFLFNNLLLLASCFAVLWGTLFPVISEYATGDKISLDAVWFNRLMIPIGLSLLFLTGVGPLFAWRRTSIESMRRNFRLPGIAACTLAVVLFAAGAAISTR